MRLQGISLLLIIISIIGSLFIPIGEVDYFSNGLISYSWYPIWILPYLFFFTLYMFINFIDRDRITRRGRR